MTKTNTYKAKNAPIELVKSDNYVVRKLGTRLSHLFYWAQSKEPYDHIWDLCCDHGRLGLHLFLNRRCSTQHIHLLDRVPSIISSIERKHYPLINDQLDLMCMDACQLKIEEEQIDNSHLFIIAGVGGETAAKIIAAILANNYENFASTNTPFDFILSSNGQTFELRNYLIEADFALIEETFITDNGRSHEHLLVQKQVKAKNSITKLPVSLVGAQIWQPLTDVKKDYIQKQILHYKKCAQLKGEERANLAYMAYSKLIL